MTGASAASEIDIKKRPIAEPVLQCFDMTKTWDDMGTRITAVENLSLEVYRGEMLAIIGPSGCGKTTTIQVLSGLEAPTSGYVALNGSRITAPVPGCILVSQEPALFPWLTAQKNVEFPLMLRGMEETERKHKAMQMIRSVGLF